MSTTTKTTVDPIRAHLQWVLVMLATLALLFGFVGCEQKKAEDDEASAKQTQEEETEEKRGGDEAGEKPDEGADEEKASADEGGGEGEDEAAAGDAPEEYLKVTVEHHTDKPPVEATFETFSVKEASIDWEDLSKSSATIEVDLNSFKSGIEKRDKHVKSPDFLNTPEFGTATVKIHGIEKGDADGTFKATASMDLRGTKKDLPVQFKVVEKDETSAVVEGTASFMRQDFGVGGAPEKMNAANKVDVNLRVKVETGDESG